MHCLRTMKWTGPKKTVRSDDLLPSLHFSYDVRAELSLHSFMPHSKPPLFYISSLDSLIIGKKSTLRHSEQIYSADLLLHNYRTYGPTKAHSVLPCCCGCVTDRGIYCVSACVCVYVTAAQSLPSSLSLRPATSPPGLAWVALTSCTPEKV